MKKLILIGTCFLFLSACATDSKVTKEIMYVDKPIPFYIVPAPPKVTRPVWAKDSLDIDKNSLRQNPGLVSRAIKLTMEQKDEYILLLEEIINKYNEMSIESKNKLRELSNENGPLSSSGEDKDIENSVVDSNSKHLREIILTEELFNNIEYKIEQIEKMELNEKVE
jgi:hypothetical protein